MKPQAEIDRMIDLWAQRKSYREIAGALGWSRSSVERIVKKLKLPARVFETGVRRRFSEPDRQRIIDMRSSGARLADLAKEFKCSTSTVNLICRPDDGAASNSNIPPEVLADRDYRLSRPPRDLTGVLMGDPPVGCSALDKIAMRAEARAG